MTLSRDVIDGLPYVEGVLNYLAPMAERPINLAYDPPPGVARSTGVPEAHCMTIYNVRPVAARLSLDSEGLALVTHNSAVRDFYDEDQLRRVYFPEAERLVAEVTGAARVLVFDHTVRRRVSGGVDRSAGTPRQPVTVVHNDPWAARAAQLGRALIHTQLRSDRHEVAKGKLAGRELIVRGCDPQTFLILSKKNRPEADWLPGLSGGAGTADAPRISAIGGNLENIYSLGVLLQVTQLGHLTASQRTSFLR